VTALLRYGKRHWSLPEYNTSTTGENRLHSVLEITAKSRWRLATLASSNHERRQLTTVSRVVTPVHAAAGGKSASLPLSVASLSDCNAPSEHVGSMAVGDVTNDVSIVPACLLWN